MESQSLNKPSIGLEKVSNTSESPYSFSLTLAGEEIAEMMTEDKITYYLKIAQESIDKSNLAILGGSKIILFGVLLPALFKIAAHHGLIRYPILEIEPWIAQGVFVLLGIYLCYQGVICKIEAIIQTKVMDEALKWKKGG